MIKDYKQDQDINKQIIYEGKAKRVFKGETTHVFLLEFKDSLTAFNGAKKGHFENKGALNRDITSLLFKKLSQKGVRSHWISDVGLTGMLVHEVTIIPLEVVVRNRLAGSTAKKLGIEEGKDLERPLVEFYYKNDSLSDPFVSDDQVLMLGVATQDDLVKLKELALVINRVLLEIFSKVGIDLIDFKLEFGKNKQGEILLADEITPDCCRLWEKTTMKKLDKDRFRRDLDGVKEGYEEVYRRLKGEMIHRFGVKVMPREVLLDTQGRAVEQTLRLHQEPVKSCRVGKFIELEIEGEVKASQERAYEIACNVLHNPLIETFELTQLT